MVRSLIRKNPYKRVLSTVDQIDEKMSSLGEKGSLLRDFVQKRIEDEQSEWTEYDWSQLWYHSTSENANLPF